jgi:hypothetical protein
LSRTRVFTYCRAEEVGLLLVYPVGLMDLVGAGQRQPRHCRPQPARRRGGAGALRAAAGPHGGVEKRAGGTVAGPDGGPWRSSYRWAPPLLEVSTVRPCSICAGARLIWPPANRAEVVARSRRGSNNPRRAGQGSRCRRLLCKDDNGFVHFRSLGGAAGLDRKERGGWIWWEEPRR